MTVVCKNCANHFKGKFCPNCSQKASTGRLKVSNVLEELWHNFTHTDKSVVGLIASLFKNPGLVIREYIDGKRKKYFNPYTFFLVSGGILIFFTMKVFSIEDELYKFYNEFGQYTSEHYTVILLASMPFLAGLLRLVFWKREINYSEWVIFFVFAYCIINVIQIGIQLLYFPLIKYHRSWLGVTELFTYFILLFVLVSFIRPVKFIQWLQCIVSITVIFFFVEILAKLAALWLVLGVPLKMLLKNFSLF